MFGCKMVWVSSRASLGSKLAPAIVQPQLTAGYKKKNKEHAAGVCAPDQGILAPLPDQTSKSTHSDPGLSEPPPVELPPAPCSPEATGLPKSHRLDIACSVCAGACHIRA